MLRDEEAGITLSLFLREPNMIQPVYSPLELVPWNFLHSAVHRSVRLIEGAATGVALNNGRNF